MSNPIVEITLREMVGALRPILERALAANAAEERKRIVEALPDLLNSLSGMTVSPPQQPRTTILGANGASSRKARAAKNEDDGRKGLRPGSNNHTVYQMIGQMENRLDGVDADMVHTYCTSRGYDIDVGQVRTALKVLGRSGYLVRRERGRYALKNETPPDGSSEGASEIVREPSFAEQLSGNDQPPFPDRDPG